MRRRFSLATPSGIGPWFIVMLTINGLIGIVAQPHLMAAVGTGKDENDCRVGFLYGTFVKRFCTVGWAMVGLMVAAMIARGTFRRHVARGSGRSLRLRLPPPAVPRRDRPADRQRAGRQHGGLLGVHGGQRRAVHPKFLSQASGAVEARPALSVGRPAERHCSSRYSACSTPSF